MSKSIIERYVIESSSSSKNWIVVKYDDGSWACSCPAWIFKKGQRQNCKHINGILLKQDIQDITLNVTGINTLMQNQEEGVKPEVNT